MLILDHVLFFLTSYTVFFKTRWPRRLQKKMQLDVGKFLRKATNPLLSLYSPCQANLPSLISRFLLYCSLLYPYHHRSSFLRILEATPRIFFCLPLAPLTTRRGPSFFRVTTLAWQLARSARFAHTNITVI